MYVFINKSLMSLFELCSFYSAVWIGDPAPSNLQYIYIHMIILSPHGHP